MRALWLVTGSSLSTRCYVSRKRVRVLLMHEQGGGGGGEGQGLRHE